MLSDALPIFTRELHAWLHSHFPQAPSTALAALALCSSQAQAGQVCVDLSEWAGQRWQGLPFPALPDWLQDLAASGLLSQTDKPAPLVLEGLRLYLHRLHQDEEALAQALSLRGGDSLFLPEQIEQALAPNQASSHASQHRAAQLALRHRVSLIGGGPGSGKTTTVAKVLAALLLLAPRSRIRLAAPTGKAAARMLESIRQAKGRLTLNASQQAAIPDEAVTLHRLLGFAPDSARPRFNRERPLALDILVVDEASMIDLSLLRRLLDALPQTAQLILLGDHEQLSPVEAGQPFAELLSLGTSHPRLGIAMLEGSLRFSAQGGIAQLARLSQQGLSAAAMTLLRSAPELAWHAGPRADWVSTLLSQLQQRLSRYRQICLSDDIAAAWQAFNQVRLLCALREGDCGVEAINQLIARQVMGVDSRKHPVYAGRPVIIRANDPGLNLANGDLGLTLPTPEGLRVFFPQQQGWRSFAPSRLPRHDTAFALTVHQAQGSEFDEAWLILPDQDAQVLDRSLIYTAITRARQGLTIWGSAATLDAALQRAAKRSGGLAARLAMVNCHEETTTKT